MTDGDPIGAGNTADAADATDATDVTDTADATDTTDATDATDATDRPRVAVFRPDDERIDDAAALLESLGAEPVADPMLAVEPTDAVPVDAPYVVLTSKTGVELAAEAGWDPGDATLVAIGPSISSPTSTLRRGSSRPSTARSTASASRWRARTTAATCS